MPNDAINEFLENMPDGPFSNSVEVAKKLVAGKENVEVTFKRDVVTPVRSESPRRSHRFWSVDGFIEYLQKYATADLVVLADPTTGTMQAVLDETSQSGFEVVGFEPQYHPLFAPWACAITTGRQPIAQFARFIVGQRHVIVDPDPKQLAMMLSQVRVSKKVEIQAGFGADSINGLMVESKIRGQMQNTSVELPEAIEIECPMFMETLPARMSISLILDDNNGVVVELISSDVQQERVRGVEAMLGKVGSALESVVCLGTVAHLNWEYVR